jgi:type IV pilus assembly protein PilE
MQTARGFNLLEILISLVIIGILTGLSFPLYSQHITHARRLEAKIALAKLAAALEEYSAIHNTYQGATLATCGFSDLIAKNNYRLRMTTLTNDSFSLAASPLSNQAKQDTLCATLTLNAAGEIGITGSGQIADCW